MIEYVRIPVGREYMESLIVAVQSGVKKITYINGAERILFNNGVQVVAEYTARPSGRRGGYPTSAFDWAPYQVKMEP